MKLRKSVTATAISLAILASGYSSIAFAELARVGPVNPAHGYPEWYQDKTGLALDLCLPDAADLIAGNCLLLPPDVPSGTAPETFPSNFADEHFWWHAGSLVDTQGPDGTISESASLVLALEAAFNAGVAPGGQIAFGRIRVKITAVPSDGDYKIIHPYGELNFPGLKAGDKIFYTDDVGLTCAPGDFSCALQTGVGPFLRASATPGGAPLDPVLVNGKLMLADPVNPTFVTGGVNSVFRVEGPNIGGPGINFIETSQFDLMGRVHTAPIPSPLKSDRAVYSRNSSQNGGTAWIDVFASALPGIGKPNPNLSIAGTGVEAKSMQAGANGFYWGQTTVTSNTVPSQVQVINNADVPPTVVGATVEDQVTITEAVYDPIAGKLSVKAKSSDEGPNPPQLYLPDYGNNSCDNILGVVIDLAVPPSTVTVRSMAGGSATLPVAIKQGPQIQVVAGDLSGSGDEDTLITVNLAPANSSGTPTFAIMSQPAHGNVSVAPDGIAAYMPAMNFNGSDSFTYTVTNNGQTSNVATVMLTVNPVNDAPSAANDQAKTIQSLPVQINLLANDSDPDATTGINPASVEIVAPPIVGSVSVSNGVATYTPDLTAAGAGTFSFTYRVADTTGAWSNIATATIDVAGAEVFDMVKSRYLISKARWVFDGTSSILAGQTVTVRFANGAQAGMEIGSAVVDAFGSWAIDLPGSTIKPLDSTRVTATSALGGSETQAIEFRR